jgi:hypothetical protein
MNEPAVFAFVKITKQAHSDDFRKGRLYMNTLEYFRTLEGNDERADPFEGTLSLLQASRSQIIVDGGGKAARIDSLFGQVKLSAGNAADYNVFCMFAVTDTSQKDLTSNTNKKLGDYAAFVIDGDAFLDRVGRHLREKAYPFNHGLVSYVDIERHHGVYGPFVKPAKHAAENEFRILIRTDRKCPVILDVGDLSDIVFVCPTEELLWRLKVKA